MKICKECRWVWYAPSGRIDGWACRCPKNPIHPQTGNPKWLRAFEKNPGGNCTDWEAKPPKRSLWQWLTRQG